MGTDQEIWINNLSADGKNRLNYTEVETMLNKKSGMLGISQHSIDVRALLAAIDDGNKNTLLAIDMFCYKNENVLVVI